MPSNLSPLTDMLTLEFWLALPLLLGSIQGMIWVPILWTSHSNQQPKANRTLAILLLFWSIHLGYAFGMVTGEIQHAIHLLRIPDVFPLLHGPLILYYVVLMTGSDRSIQRRNLVHFLPFVVGTLSLLPFIFSGEAEKLNFFREMKAGNPGLHFQILYILKMLITLVYLWMALRHLKKHRNFLREVMAETQTRDLRWLHNLLMGISVIWLLGLLRPVLGFGEGSVLLMGVTLSVLIYLISIYTLRQPPVKEGLAPETLEILKADNQPHSPKTELPDEGEKYVASTLASEQANAMAKRLLELMVKDKPYLNPDCNLACLADALGVKPHLLSQVLNEKIGQTFYEFFNGYRVKKAHSMLEDPQYDSYSIAGIGEAAGFRSRSTFYASFRKAYGATPSQLKARRNRILS